MIRIISVVLLMVAEGITVSNRRRCGQRGFGGASPEHRTITSITADSVFASRVSSSEFAALERRHHRDRPQLVENQTSSTP